MSKKLLESAFIDLIDIQSEQFQNRKYFFYRWAVRIEKQIGLTSGKRVVAILDFENQQAKLPELAIKVVSIIPTNLFSLNEGEVKDFDFYKNITQYELKSLRFAEQDNVVVISQDIATCTIVYDTFETNEFNQPLVDESHIMAIQHYIKYRIVENERILCALKGGGNYYQLKAESAEQQKEYNLYIINAKAEERFKETEEVIEKNDVIINLEDNNLIIP